VGKSVESSEDDLRAALLDTSERLRRLVKRELERMRADARRPMHRPLGRSWRERSSRTGVEPDGCRAGRVSSRTGIRRRCE
jgi:hypothetical protein